MEEFEAQAHIDAIIGQMDAIRQADFNRIAALLIANTKLNRENQELKQRVEELGMPVRVIQGPYTEDDE